MLGIEYFFFFQAEDGIRDFHVTGVQTCALPICVDIGTTGQRSKAIAHPRGPALGDFRGAMRYRVAKRSNLKPIGERAKRRRVACRPRLPETNDSNAKFHGYRSGLIVKHLPLYTTFVCSR